MPKSFRTHRRLAPPAGLTAFALTATAWAGVGVADAAATTPATDQVLAAGRLGQQLPSHLVTRALHTRTQLDRAAAVLDRLGVDYGKRVDDGDLARGAHRLGLQVGKTVDPGDIDRIVQRDRDRANWILRQLGFDWQGPLTDATLMAAANKLGLDIGERVDPTDISRIVAAGPHEIARRAEARRHAAALARKRDAAGAKLSQLGVDWGKRLDDNDLVRAAHRFGLKVGERLDAGDIDRIAAVADRRLREREAARQRARAAAARSRMAAIAHVPFATVGGVQLVPPSRNLKMIGFHQASYPVARQMTPTGRPGMRTLPSRRRPTGRQTAADIAVVPNTTIYAPVTGTVVEARRYSLYGKYADTRIRIVPDSNPHLLLSMLHVTGAKVGVGQRVTAGHTPVAERATQFPFWSQIDGFAGHGPHVHIEVRRR